jgi:hypothetical protein
MSRDSSVTLVTSLRQRRAGVRILEQARHPSVLRNVQTGFETHTTYYLIDTVVPSRNEASGETEKQWSHISTPPIHFHGTHSDNCHDCYYVAASFLLAEIICLCTCAVKPHDILKAKNAMLKYCITSQNVLFGVSLCNVVIRASEVSVTLQKVSRYVAISHNISCLYTHNQRFMRTFTVCEKLLKAALIDQPTAQSELNYWTLLGIKC